MNDRKLYVVGNGFDMWHGIPSGFPQFKAFVEEHDRDLLGAVDDYLPVDEKWYELESSLAAIDVDSIIDNLGHFMSSYNSDDWSDSGHHDFQYEVDRLVQRLSTGLRHLLGQWIRQLPIPTKVTAPQLLRTIDPTARFLTFNYTPTLHELYSVPDQHVLHIHGRADHPDSDMVLGHAWNPLERKSLNDRADIEEIDTRLMEVHDILDKYFSTTFKPSARLIEEYRPCFERLVGVNDVCVLGHSLSPVDGAYFKALLAIPGIRSARWQVAYRDGDDDPLLKLLQLGVPASSIVICPWSEL